MCKHSSCLTENNCYLCIHQNDPQVSSKLKNNDKIDFNSNFGDLWSVEEIVILYVSLKDLKSRKCAEFKKKAKEVSLVLGRTRLSVVWHYRIIFEFEQWDHSKNMLKAMEQVTK